MPSRYRAPGHVSESRALRYWENAAKGSGSHGFEPSAKGRGKGTDKGEGKAGDKGGANGTRGWTGKGFEPSDKGKGSFKGKGK